MSVALPAVGYEGGLPALVRSVSQSRVGNRSIAMVEYADPFWRMDMVTEPLDFTQQAAVRAFLDEAGAGMKTVDYAPVFLPLPEAYRTDRSNAALADDGNLVSITGGSSLSIDGVTDGLVLQRGDMLSLAYDGFKSLHRILTGGTAAAGAIAITVEPFVPGYIAAGAVVKFKNLSLNTRLLPGSAKIGDQFRDRASFTLIEVPK